MTAYNHIEIESKWQNFWETNKTFQASIDTSKPKYYVLDMFPYPSGSGLHVGHLVGYTATDIVARYKRMKGFNVLHPMGWDSFGLPAEQYAIRTGTHPAVTTQQNIDNFRRQLKSLGFSYDWSREVATSDEKYYKWTQWIFLLLYEKGLAYEAEIPVNFCPFLGTVLANEEVDNGKSKEGGHDVIRIPLRQWILKITAYADRLIEDLDTLDWPESIKQLQLNWIGKSTGAKISFPLVGQKEKIEIFTTSHDTIFGTTYIVLSPEHPLVPHITTTQQRGEVEAYCEQARSKSEIERTELSKDKTGVFTGAYCSNPVNDEVVPVWIADYVLSTYGTGAVMGVPGHCERDNEFAHKYKLPIKTVVKPVNREYTAEEQARSLLYEDGIIINSSSSKLSLDNLSSEDARKALVKWLKASGHGDEAVQYKLRDWLFSRQRYWGEPIPILHYEDGSMRPLDLDELPLTPPKLTDFKPSGDGKSPLAKVKEWVEVIDPKSKKRAFRETNTMPQWAGSCWYYLRFADPGNPSMAWAKEAERYWLPVDLYVGGIEHATLHLLYARFWHKVLFDCGLVSTKEPFSSLRNQGLVIARSYKNSSNAYVDPSSVVERDGQYFHRETGELLKSAIDKMSKSKLNGVSPDEIIKEYGADALRVYEMFMGPLEKEKTWNTAAVAACRRFLARAFELVSSKKVVEEETFEGLKLMHRLVAKATNDFEAMQFNTTIAKMMEFINEFSRFEKYPKKSLCWFCQVLAPFAPHIAEEMWQLLGQNGSITTAPFPVADPQYLEDPVVTYVIQVNGKLRGRVDLPKDKTLDELAPIAFDHPNVQKFLDGQQVKKTIFVPNKILNFVV